MEENVWECDICGVVFDSEKEALKHSKACLIQNLQKDRIKNPTLARISNHLWWLALMAKISIIFMLLTIVSILL
jgi:hypothetical protein